MYLFFTQEMIVIVVLNLIFAILSMNTLKKSTYIKENIIKLSYFQCNFCPTGYSNELKVNEISHCMQKSIKLHFKCFLNNGSFIY